MTAISSRIELRTARRVALWTGLLSLALILGALGFQYLGGLAACEMCHWQRWPHIASAAAGLVLVPLLPKEARLLAWLCVLLVLTSGLIGAYQTGMQLHWLPGPEACTAHRFVMGSHVTPEVQCDVVTWSLFGLSLAAYNAIICLVAAGLGAYALSRRSL